MPKLPRNVIQRGVVYYLRLMVDGKVYQRSLGRDLKLATRKAKQMKDELRSGRTSNSSPASTPTFADFSSRWLSEYVKQRRTVQNYLTAQQRLTDHILPVLGRKRLSEVSYGDLRTLRGKLDGTRRADGKGLLSPKTVTEILGDVRGLLSYAKELDVISDTPWRTSLRPKVKEQAPKGLTEEQVTKVLEVTPKKYQLAVKLSLLTGIRWSELQRLQWKDVKDLPTPHLVLENTKNGKVRRVPLSSTAVKLLTEEKQTNRSVYVLRWRAKHGGSFVRYTLRRLSFKWNWHQLRHTAACRWLEAGGSKESLQKVLGHSSITQTERYGALSDEAVFTEAGKLNLRV